VDTVLSGALAGQGFQVDARRGPEVAKLGGGVQEQQASLHEAGQLPEARDGLAGMKLCRRG